MKSLFFVMKNIPKKPTEEAKQIEQPSTQYKSYINLVKSTVIILTIKNKYLSLFEPIQPKFFLTHHFCLILSELKERYKNRTIDKKKISEISNHSPIPYKNKNNYEKKSNFLNNTVYELDPLIKKDIDNKKYLNKKRLRENNENKKKIFNLDKIHEKTKVKHIGRKKKNSGEFGAHNKYSNDNMMRKLKNKVIESARKLISRTIKEESNNEFNDLHKIGGEFSQELNIKFNFWFYFQKFKDIFQFKCSTKYRNNYASTNKELIEKIYLNENNKFPLSKKLLEMSFCQYFHEIFLDENPNWKNIFKIPFDENYYEINFFFNNIRTSYEYIPQDDELYIEKFSKLADDYELFFLVKNPRNYLKKEKDEKNEKNIEIKTLIDNLERFDKNNEELKIQFLLSAIKYKPQLNKYILNLNKKPF